MKLAVNEVFGPTIQGEGPNVGRPAVFLRLYGCNLRCQWCDSKYSWDSVHYDASQEVHVMTTQEAAFEVMKHLPDTVDLLVVTGGEPMLQQERLADLMTHLSFTLDVEIETAGTVAPIRPLLDMGCRFNVSLKLASSGNPLRQRYKPEAIKALQSSGRASWKFVATSVDDFEEIDELVRKHALSPVFVMPEGTDRETVLTRAAELAPDIIERGYRLTLRDQVLLWGSRRGV